MRDIMTLRNKVIYVAVISIATCLAAVGFSAWQLYNNVSQEIHDLAGNKLTALHKSLELTDDSYFMHNKASMRFLRNVVEAAGPARLADGETMLADKEPLPALYFGNELINGNNDAVDKTSNIQGGGATVFIRQGQDFWRIATNVKKDDGSRAVGTKLDPSSKAYQSISAGKEFYGLVNILGKPYLTGYEPIIVKGVPVGIFYVGTPLTALDSLKETIKNEVILNKGFVALLDEKQVPMFASKTAPTSDALQSILAGKDNS